MSVVSIGKLYKHTYSILPQCNNSTVPPPEAVSITSSHTSTVIIGNNDTVVINLTCSVELNTAVDVHSVMTSIDWTGSNGFNVGSVGLTDTTPINVTPGGNFSFTCTARVVPATEYSGLISGIGLLSRSFHIQGGMFISVLHAYNNNEGDDSYIIHLVTIDMNIFHTSISPVRVGNELELICNITLRDSEQTVSVHLNASLVWMTPDDSSDRISITNSTNIRNSFSSILSIESLELSDSGEYACIATLFPSNDSPEIFNTTHQYKTIQVLLRKYMSCTKDLNLFL